jgi:hypothetical protein
MPEIVQHSRQHIKYQVVNSFEWLIAEILPEAIYDI